MERTPMKTRLNRFTIVLLLLLGALAGKRASAQTLYTPGGLLLHPTAYTDKRGTASLYVSAFTQTEFGTEQKTTSRSSETYPISLSYAVSDRLTAGLGYLSHRGAIYHEDGMFMYADHTHWGGFVKYQLAPETSRRPALAVVGTYNEHDTLQTSVTLVASKAFGNRPVPDLVLHGGVGWAQKYMGRGTVDDAAPFVAIEKPLNARLSLAGEYGWRYSFNRDAIAGVGLLWKVDATQVNLGYVNAGRSRDYGFFIGIGIPLGGAR